MKKTILLVITLGMAAPVWVPAADPPADIKQIWEKTCASCHGLTGKADTKIGKKIGAIDFTDPKNQAKFTDEQMFKAIKEGVNDKNGKNIMKPIESSATDAQIKGLIAFIRTLKK